MTSLISLDGIDDAISVIASPNSEAEAREAAGRVPASVAVANIYLVNLAEHPEDISANIVKKVEEWVAKLAKVLIGIAREIGKAMTFTIGVTGVVIWASIEFSYKGD